MFHSQRFVFEACQDLTLAILMVAAAISLTLGMTTEVLCYILISSTIRFQFYFTPHSWQFRTVKFCCHYCTYYIFFPFQIFLFQGPDEGWYDGGSIFLAVFLVILVTGNVD